MSPTPLEESIAELGRELARSLVQVYRDECRHLREVAAAAIAEGLVPIEEPEPRSRRARPRRPASPPTSIPPDDSPSHPGIEEPEGSGQKPENVSRTAPTAPVTTLEPPSTVPEGRNGAVHGLETPDEPDWIERARAIARARRERSG